MWGKRPKAIADEDRVIKNVEKSRERTMTRAVNLLAAKPRAVAELRERLLEKAWTNHEIVDRVIEKLKEYGYLDDEQYASDLALSRLRERPQGKRRLQQMLSQKQLDKTIVEDAIKSAFEKIPEEDLITAAIEKRVRLKGRPQTREDLKKFYDHLLRRGFSYSLIREKMNSVGGPGPDEEMMD